MTTPVFYARIEAAGSTLNAAPALASWDRAGSPGQVRSAGFIAQVRSAVAEQLRASLDPLALRLDIGLPDTVPLLARNDLDNYLFPLVPKLTESTGRQFASVWATKRHAETSTAAADTACSTHDPGGTYSFKVRTTASASTTAYKQQIRDQITAGRPLPDGGIALQLAFTVGPGRAWPNLWKATIDSLGSLSGSSRPAMTAGPFARSSSTTLAAFCDMAPASKKTATAVSAKRACTTPVTTGAASRSRKPSSSACGTRTESDGVPFIGARTAA